MSQMINLKIDGESILVPAGTTVMDAAEKLGVHIPRLCYHPDLSLEGNCRVCVVEVDGFSHGLASCATKAWEGMEVQTNSPMIRQARRDIVELLLDNHPKDCQTCDRDGNCELQNLSYRMGIRERLYEGKRKHFPVDDSGASVVRNAEKCILCGRCIRVCGEVQGVFNLSQHGRGFETVVGPANLAPMDESTCIQCGQCVNVCPTAAFVEKDHTERVWKALSQRGEGGKHVVVTTAPAIRAALGESFGLPVGTPVTGKMVTALHRMGFDSVLDVNFAADLTIMEEAHELLHRIATGGPLPLITSCSPGWISFLEKFYPELIPNTSSCKSPMQMQSTLVKTYYAEQKGIDPKDIYVVSVMPCVAKKFEAARPEHTIDGMPTTDAVLTTRELAHMIKSYGIDFNNLPESDFDHPLGTSSGAADIFGATGGVMEAALRTAAFKLTGQNLGNLELTEVRGVTGQIRETTISLAGTKVNVAVSNGLENAKILLDAMKRGEKQYHLIEIMACPGGCICGGGQPYPPMGTYTLSPDLATARAKALYDIDSGKTLRCSHDNPDIQKLYADFLGEPLSHKAHELLHTHYTARTPRGIR
jgi:iron-only hydrogenase group A